MVLFGVRRQAFTAAHEYCHYVKAGQEGPLIDNPDVFIDDYVSLYHPREKFAQTFAACFLMPASKVRAIIEKESGGRPVYSDRYKLLQLKSTKKGVAEIKGKADYRAKVRRSE
jgi:Zn-dependent peptidase ImmA (M78 family)